MLYRLIRPLLFLFDPEQIHSLSLDALRLCQRLGLLNCFFKTPHKPCTVMGLNFPNPVGLAAGFDKNAEYIEPLGALGFGFLEVGTVTPNKQSGNPRPRLFRMPKRNALINCLGFNNHGLDVFVKNLQKRNFAGVLGVSITKNNDTPDKQALQDYLTCMRAVYPYADYLSIDISCPNVSGHSSVLVGNELATFLKGLKAEQQALEEHYNQYVPMAIKVSPDMSPKDTQDVAENLLRYQLDAVIATNTSSTRRGVEGCKNTDKKGGLSGGPLFPLALNIVKQLHHHLQDKIPIIAVGGIMSAEDAQLMRAAGASLIQLYTGLIYKGPGLITNIVNSFS